MLTVLTLLGMPVCAGAYLALDHYVRENATRDELSFLSLLLRLVGMALAGVGLALMGVAALGGNAAPQNRFFDILLRMGAGGFGLMGIAVAVISGAFRAPRDVSDLREELRQEQRASLARLLAWTLVLAPLSPFVPLGVLVVPLVLTTILASWGAINRGSQISLLWRLAIAVENQLPFAEEVEAASPGVGRGRREALAGLADRLRDGQSLSQALDDHSRLLPRGDMLAIRATDGTAALAPTLRECAERSVRDLSMLREGGTALPLQAYVVNVVLILLSLLGFLMYWIVPKFKEIFNDFGVELPGVSRTLFSFSDDAAAYWFVLGPMLCIPLVGLLIPPLIAMAGWENLNFPLLMQWFPRRDAPEVLRMLASILDSGRPFPAALRDVAAHHPRDDLRVRLSRLADDLEAGESPWGVLSRERFLKSREAAALEAAAENNHLPWALRLLADSIDSRQRMRSAWILEWQRPVLIGSLGILVAYFCAAMFMPLVSIIDQAREIGP